MNTVVTSREQILAAARELALSGGELSMRAVAARCGIAVGSIYNYYPTKADLTIAVVAEVWQEIFHPGLCADAGSGPHCFAALVRRLAQQVAESGARYPGFFVSHRTVIGDKNRGRQAMQQYSAHIERALCETLARDTAVRAGVFDAAFSPAALAAFVLDFLREDLMRGTDRSAFLLALLDRTLY